jgi:hypothetical protein
VDNSPKAASNAYAANAAISDSSSSVTNALTGVSIEGINASTVSPALALIKRAYNPGTPALLTGIALSQACSGGGTISLNGTVHSEQAATNGDMITFTAVNCVEVGATLNGAFKVTLSGLTNAAFTGTAWGATIDIEFNAFSVASGSEAFTAAGDMKIVINQASATSNSIAVSGKSLQTTERKAGVAVASRNLTNYSATSSAQGNKFTTSTSFTVSGNSSSLAQFEYSVKNIQPFVSTGGAPTAGSLIVIGAASSVTMTVVDATHVRLDYSAKGDGTITQTTTVTWAAFLANL